MRGRGACVMGGHAWGHTWQGVCMAGGVLGGVHGRAGMHGRGHA